LNGEINKLQLRLKRKSNSETLRRKMRLIEKSGRKWRRKRDKESNRNILKRKTKSLQTAKL